MAPGTPHLIELIPGVISFCMRISLFFSHPPRRSQHSSSTFVACQVSQKFDFFSPITSVYTFTLSPFDPPLFQSMIRSSRSWLWGDARWAAVDISFDDTSLAHVE